MKKTALLCSLLGTCAILAGLLAGCEPKKGAPGGGKAATPAAEKAPAKASQAAATSQLILPSAGASSFITEKNFVMDWLVLGLFKFKEADFAGDQQQASADHAFMPNEGDLDGTQAAPAGTTWQALHFKGDAQAGQVNLDKLYSTIDYAAAYAVAWLDCPEAVANAKILAGSDDYLKIWVNGKLVHTYKTARRASDRDQDAITGITLKKGLNRIVVKCVDVVFDWDFYFRLADGKDAPIAIKPKG